MTETEFNELLEPYTYGGGFICNKVDPGSFTVCHRDGVDWFIPGTEAELVEILKMAKCCHLNSRKLEICEQALKSITESPEFPVEGNESAVALRMALIALKSLQELQELR